MLDRLMKALKAGVSDTSPTALHERAEAARADVLKASEELEELQRSRREVLLSGDSQRLAEVDQRRKQLEEELPDLEYVAAELRRRAKVARYQELARVLPDRLDRLPALCTAIDDARTALKRAERALAKEVASINDDTIRMMSDRRHTGAPQGGWGSMLPTLSEDAPVRLQLKDHGLELYLPKPPRPKPEAHATKGRHNDGKVGEQGDSRSYPQFKSTPKGEAERTDVGPRIVGGIAASADPRR